MHVELAISANQQSRPTQRQFFFQIDFCWVLQLDPDNAYLIDLLLQIKLNNQILAEDKHKPMYKVRLRTESFLPQ